MRKLLLNSFLIVFVLAFISCSNIKNKAVTTNTKSTNVKSEIPDTISTGKAILEKGDSISSKSSNIESSEKGSYYKEFEVKHNAPNQSEIDSIKRKKTKGKR